MSIYDKASLVLIPSGSKTSKVYSQKPTNGDGDFTFSRSTAATRVNADGNIEKETGNLLLQSNSFLTGWGLSNVTMTGGQAGYDGTNNAWLMTDTNSGAYGIIDRLVTTGGITTFSCYAKSGTTDIVGLRPIGGSSPYVFFDLSNGTFEAAGDTANLIDWDIQDAGGGWYRCSVTTSATATQVLIYIATTGGALAPSGSTLYIQHAQVEQGLVARDYIETTTTAIYGGITDNVPRLDYQGSCPALLLEPQRTNLVDYSEYYDLFDNNVTLTTNADTSPEGVDNASKIVVSSESQPRIERYNTWSDSTNYSMSAYVKADTGRYIGFGLYSPEMGNQWVRFDLTNETFGYSDTNWSNAAIVDAGDDWYRISATITTDATNTSRSGFKLASMKSNSYNTGTIGDSFFVYGIQVEQGSYATSYIPTYGSAVTRNADRNETTPNTLISSQVFSMFFEYTPTGGGTSGSTPAFELNIQGTSNNVSFYVNNGGANDGLNIYLGATNGGYLWGTATNNGWTLNQKSKVALTYDGNNLRYFINGVLHRSQTGVSFTDANTALYILHAKGNEVEQALVFPTALTDQEAIDLTTL